MSESEQDALLAKIEHVPADEAKPSPTFQLRCSRRLRRAERSICGLEFISGSDYEVLFRHQRTGRVYGIVAPDYDVFAPGMSL
jgi:hypothetical protein